ncbi:MAG: SLC13 family permease [Candidatus Omnitrophica bacterium]|nr:SLC13 family permease [Candidatus Omnitrophota bacterium]
MVPFQKPLSIFFILVAVALLLGAYHFTAQQIIAVLVFLLVICGTLFYWQFRLAFAYGGIALLLATHLLDIRHVIEFAGLDIILFLVGMMILIGFMEEKHFFEYLIARVVDRIGKRPYLLMAVMICLAALTSALVGEVVSILFMLSAMFHLCRRYGINPIPFLLMLVFATNIGSSATAIGNPIGIMIAMRGHLTFVDFLRWAFPIALVLLILSIPVCFLWFGSSLREIEKNMREERTAVNEAGEMIHKKGDIRLCWILFIGTVLGLVFHASFEKLLGLEKNTLLLATALLAGSVVLFIERGDARSFFTRRVDWWTLAFFMALFASIGTLEYVGVTQRIAEGMAAVGRHDETLLLIVFSGTISLLTGFLDNVLAVAAFIPILHSLEDTGVYTYPFWWGMLFGGTLFGNLTVIGSTANIVAMGMLEQEFKKHIPFMEWFKPGLLISLLTLVLALFLLYCEIPLMPR